MKNFFSFEGGEGVGKSTVIQLVAAKLRLSGHEVIVTREPGGTELGEQLRTLIFANSMSLKMEILLFAAAREEHLNKVILPALKAKKIILCDRFVDSSYVYQGIVHNHYDQVKEINYFVIDENLPEKTFFFDLAPEVALKRITTEREINRFDEKELKYHQQIYDGFKKLAAETPRFKVIDASVTPDKIAEQIIREINE